jgi:hypothetical protein
MGTTPRSCDSIFGGRADGVDGAHSFAEQVGEFGVVGGLVFAAEDEVDAAGEGGDGLWRGVDVGGLGVVVEVDAVEGGDEFQAMLDGLEAATVCGWLRGGAGEAGRADSGEDVLDVVLALEGNLGRGQDGLSRRFLWGGRRSAVLDPGALRRAFRRTSRPCAWKRRGRGWRGDVSALSTRKSSGSARRRSLLGSA